MHIQTSVMQHALELTKLEEIDKDTWVIQTDDGILFYWRSSAPQRLYVKWKEREIDAKLPDSILNCDGANGNSVYFTMNRKIYNAIFTPNDGITVSYVRDQEEGEKARWEFYSQVRDGKKYVYRLCDDIHDDTAINVSDEELKGLYLRRLHRGKVIYFSINSEASTPCARKFTENAIVVKARDLFPLDVRDSSPFIYVSDKQRIFTLDTRKMEFLPVLHTGDHIISYIVGVHKGVMHFVSAKSDSSLSLMRTQLPSGYFENSNATNGERLCNDTMLRRYQEITHLLKNLRERNNQIEAAVHQNEQMKAEMEATILEQQRALSLLTEEIKLLRKIENENTEIKNAVFELQRANFDLTKEKELIQTSHGEETSQLKNVIIELRAEIAELKQERERYNMESDEEYDGCGDTVNELKAVIANLRMMKKSQKLDQTTGHSIRKDAIDEEAEYVCSKSIPAVADPHPHSEEGLVPPLPSAPPPKPPRQLLDYVSLSEFPHELHIPAYFNHKAE